jgi:hypothetical protein
MIMKRIKWVTALILASAGMVSAQSLGDYAKEIKKNKADTGTATKVYDNDNIPTDSTLSVVGPAPADATSKAAADKAAEAAATDAKAEQQKANDALQKGMDEQKQKIDALNKELDLLQREYRLQAATFYADAGNRLRDSAQWDKDQANYKSEIDAKQKEIEAARGKLDEMQEDARKAGIRQKDPDDNSKNTETSKTPDTNTDAGK